MIQKKITIINKLGLHARAAMKLSSLAARFQSEILIHFRDREVNAKSIMNVMVIAANCGAEIELRISGEDEDQAMTALVKLINDRFGEQE